MTDAVLIPPLRGIAIIQKALETAPSNPGVYRMLGAKEEVLYVGKAKNIRKRLASYARREGLVQRIAHMVSLTHSVIFISTETETDALLLEINLIKQMRPRFNVLMRDDKSFPYILLAQDHPVTQLTKHRGARQRKGLYFGPFANTSAVNKTITALQKAFLLRSCSDSYYANRQRPCLLWQIKRCSAPCTGEINLDLYEDFVRQAKDFLSGRSQEVRKRLAQEMSQASEALDYEKAARLRDRIAALSSIQGEQGINPNNVEEADVFALVKEAGQFCVEIFFFRAFQNWGNRAYFPQADASLSGAEVLDSFVTQFYNERPPPKLILLSHSIENTEILRESFRLRFAQSVQILTPQRGEKYDLVVQALTNARATLGRHLTQTLNNKELLKKLGMLFSMSSPPRRIEIYDNSHSGGSQAVGVMVVFGEEGFMKSHYRRYTIKNKQLQPGDDYGMLREVLERRFLPFKKKALDVSPLGDPSSLILETEDSSFPLLPDLVLIDGGKGQFSVAEACLKSYGLGHIALGAIAKGPERNAGHETFFTRNKSGFSLEPGDPVLYFCQRLRDEAHRFAIGTHRTQRQRLFTKGSLDSIKGIGPQRKKALLKAFGTLKAIESASLADLEKVEGINARLARQIHDFFVSH